MVGSQVGFTSSQRGAGRIKFILTMLVIVAVIGAVMKLAPVYITDQEMQHEIKEVARTAAMRKTPDAQIRRELTKRQEEYWVSLPENTEYTINRRGNSVEIKVDVTIPVDLLVTTYNYRINYSISDSEL